MFKAKTLSIGAAAKFAGKPLAEMLTMVSAAGIPVVDYPASELDEELANSKHFERLISRSQKAVLPKPSLPTLGP